MCELSALAATPHAIIAQARTTRKFVISSAMEFLIICVRIAGDSHSHMMPSSKRNHAKPSPKASAVLSGA